MAAAAASQAAVDAPVAYVVKPGDTLSQVAERYIVPSHGWRDLQRLWHLPDPQRLPPRRTLAIPRSWLRSVPEKAQFASVRGTVTVRFGRRTVPASLGTSVSEGAEIETAANSFATLVLPNGSRVALPSQSRVAFVRLRRLVINRAIDYRMALKGGKIDTKAAPITVPGGELIIGTPLTMTAVRGTEYQIGYDAGERSSGTGVFEGTVTVVRSDGTGPQRVPARFGAITDVKRQSRQVALLPEPVLKDPGRAQIDDRVMFDLAPIPGAHGYVAQLASDAGFAQSYAAQASPTPHFEFADVPSGSQYVRFAAIGEGNLEGMRQSYPFMRRPAGIRANVAETVVANAIRGFDFKWAGLGTGVRLYRLQIFRARPDGPLTLDEPGIKGEGLTISGLPDGVYFWRVGVSQTDAQGTIENWTEPQKLTVANPNGP
jgi:hypothetical protein